MNAPSEIMDFTFTADMVGGTFDAHVKEQLPFYDLVTDCVSMIVRNYLPRNGRLYDIGASTGNVTRSLRTLIKSRTVQAISIDSSQDMVDTWDGTGTAVCADAVKFDYQSFDVAVCFLSLMFMSIDERAELIDRLIRLRKTGGAIIVVDKEESGSGYYGTVMRRLTFDWKLKNGASPAAVIDKELSLSGVQRPMTIDELPNAKEFFRLGEFVGWVL